MVSSIVSLAVMTTALVIAARGRHPGEPPVQLALPLREGRFYVAHGGDSVLLNQGPPR
jgi:hypothetical protein